MKPEHALKQEHTPVARSQHARLKALLTQLQPMLMSLPDPLWNSAEGPLLLAGVLLSAAHLAPAQRRDSSTLQVGLRNLLDALPPSPLTRSVQVLQAALEDGSSELLDTPLRLQHALIQLRARTAPKTARNEILLAQGEALLAALSPTVRERHGVYFTPPPLVNATVERLCEAGALPESCLALIQEQSSLPEVLDPACGGGVFLVGVLARYQRSSFQEASGEAQRMLWEASARILLTRLRGFELLPFCLLLASAVLRTFLQDTGLQADALPLPRIELTDTLSVPPGSLQRVQVIVGNPPWRRLSAPRTRPPWEERLRQCDGLPLLERKHWLTDDYVRFFAWSLTVLEEKPAATLAFVTNNGYLAGQTLRGLRFWLWQSFTEARIWDGGGGVRHGGDSASMQKVLKIQQGLCLGLYTRLPGGEQEGAQSPPATSKRFWTYSSLEDMLADMLKAHGSARSAGAPVTPTSPLYRFAPDPLTPHDLTPRRAEWDRFIPLPDLLPIHSTGILTARDHLCLADAPETLLQRIEMLRDPRIDTEQLREALKVQDTKSWSFAEARAALQASHETNEALCAKIVYRPFQTGWLLFHRAFTWRLRAPVMEPLLHPGNLALITSRMTQGAPFTHAFLSDCPAEVITLSPHTSSNAFVFPLWVWKSTARTVNVDPRNAAALGFGLPGREGDGSSPAPHADDEALDAARTLFYYLYGILWSTAWRQRYSACLRDDFPRIPILASSALRDAVLEAGRHLASLHQTMTPPKHRPGLRLEGEEQAVIPTLPPRLSLQNPGEEVGTIALTESTRLTRVSVRAWQVKVGAYAVLEQRLRLLKKHKRPLTPEQLEALSDLHAVLDQTAVLVLRLDEAFERAGGFPQVLKQDTTSHVP